MARTPRSRIGSYALDALALAGLWGAVLAVRASLPVGPLPPVGFAGHLPYVALLVPAWLAAGAVGGRHGGRGARRPSWSAHGAQAVLGALITLGALYFAKVNPPSRLSLLMFTLASVPVTYAVSAWVRRLAPPKHVVLLAGAEGEEAPFERAVQRQPEWGVRIAGRCELREVEGALHAHASHGQRVDEVLLTGGGLSQASLRETASICEERGVRLSIDADFLGLDVRGAAWDEFDGAPVLTFLSGPSPTAERVVKRLIDVVGASIGLMLLAPVAAALALAIRLDDGGPVLYAQERAGRFGRPFVMYKLRTMRLGAHEERDALRDQSDVDGPVFKMMADPRVTRLGAWLRRTSLDEVPQLLNVLMGEMSLVGPRPPLVEEVERYERWQLRRLSMRPGLTCIWQVSGRSTLSWDEWLALDLRYIDEWSLMLDLRLMARTLPAVWSGVGAW